MGALASLLMATMILDPFMPTRCWMAPEMPTARYSLQEWKRARASALRLLNLLHQRRHHLEQVSDKPVIDQLKDGRAGILIHGLDDLGPIHADQMLDGAGDAKII